MNNVGIQLLCWIDARDAWEQQQYVETFTPDWSRYIVHCINEVLPMPVPVWVWSSISIDFKV